MKQYKIQNQSQKFSFLRTFKPVRIHNSEKKTISNPVCKIGLRLTNRWVSGERRAVSRQRGLCQMNNNFYAENKGN
jgi:hypothetical protein